MTTLIQSVTAGFAPTTGDQSLNPPTIQITGHEGVGSPDFGIPLRCYPPNCKIVASVGEVRRGSTPQTGLPWAVLGKPPLDLRSILSPNHEECVACALERPPESDEPLGSKAA